MHVACIEWHRLHLLSPLTLLLRMLKIRKACSALGESFIGADAAEAADSTSEGWSRLVKGSANAEVKIG